MSKQIINLTMITPVLKKYLEKIKVHGSDTIRDDQKYKERVVDPAWDVMPFPIRLIGRDRLRWNLIFAKMRTSVFAIEGEQVRVKTESLKELQVLIKDVWESNKTMNKL